MARLLPAVMVAAALSLPFPAAATPAMLAPSGPWHLDYSPDSCTLERAFGPDGEQVTVRFEQFQPRPVFDLVFAGKRFRSYDLVRTVKLAFGPSQPLRPAREALTGSGQTADGKDLPMLFLTGVALAAIPDDAPDDAPPPTVDEQTLTELHLVQTPGPDMVLKMGPLDRPMAEMRRCMDELMSHWGIDPAKQRTLTRPARPIGSPGTWLRSDDYPKANLFRGESALINFRLTVSAQGAVTGCAVQRQTGGAAFATASCDLIRRRARFEPALDEAGQPIASYYVNTVKWLVAR